MNKMFAVLKREYIQAVRKKTFIIMTLLFPVLMLALFLLPTLLVSRGISERKVAVLDGTGQMGGTFTAAASEAANAESKATARRKRDMPSLLRFEYVKAAGGATEAEAAPYLGRMRQSSGADRLDAVFLIPADVLTADDPKLKFYTRASTDFVTQERLSSLANRAIQRIRLEGRGITEADADKLLKRARIDSVQLSRSGQQKSGGVGNFLFGFLFAGLLLVPSLIYGLEIMRGIIQEKNERIVEVLISSMTPGQLLTGKILGVAAVGLTQIAVWLVMLAAGGAYGAATAAMMDINVMQFIRPSTFVYFVLFFVLAYLTYVCVYAIAGAACNTEKEAQQFIAPINMVMMLPWFLMFAIITNPESGLAVGFSLAPIFGPITMFVRTLVSEPPVWHIAVSVLSALAGITALFWITAKIFRVGILSYGKRPTVPEMWRWLKVA